jgi:hypothetical protein
MGSVYRSVVCEADGCRLVPVSNRQKGGALLNVDPTYIIPVETPVVVESESHVTSSSCEKQATGPKKSAVETQKKKKKNALIVKAKLKKVATAKRKRAVKSKKIKNKNGFVF